MSRVTRVYGVGDKVTLFYGATAVITAKKGQRYTFTTRHGDVIGWVSHIMGLAS